MRVLGAIAMAVAAVASAGAAQAANNPLIVWQGAITITNLTAACSSIGQGVGTLLTSVYRPRLESDEPVSGLTILSDRTAQVFFNASTSNNDQMIGRGGYLGHIIGSRATAIPNSSQGSFTGNYNFKVRPVTITADTTSITITGTLTNYFNVTGCTLSFAGAYQPRGN